MAYLDKAGLTRLCAGLKAKLLERTTLTPLATGLSWSSGSITVPGWSEWEVVAIKFGTFRAVSFLAWAGQQSACHIADAINDGTYQGTATASIEGAGNVLTFSVGCTPRYMLHAAAGAHIMSATIPAITDIYGVVRKA